MSHVLVYSQGTGLLYLEDGDGGRAILTRGYSGHGSFRDDPDAEGEAGLGPIPRGVWRISRYIYHSRLGSYAYPLVPFGHDAHGRSEFFIHGDNSRGDKSASTGCIILGRPYRQLIDLIGIDTLEVIC